MDPSSGGDRATPTIAAPPERLAGERSAEDAFLAAGGAAADVPRRAWLAAAGLLAIAWGALVLGEPPNGLRLLAAFPHRLAPAVFAGPDADLLELAQQAVLLLAALACAVLLGMALARSWRHWALLRSAYTAADARAGKPFLRRRGAFRGGAAILLLSRLLGMNALLAPGALLLAAGLAEWTVRALVARPAGPRSPAAGLRDWRTWIVAALLLAWLLLPAPVSEADRARELRRDPAVAAADARAERAYQRALATSVAQSELRRLHDLAPADHRGEPDRDAALRTTALSEDRLRELASAWTKAAARRLPHTALLTECPLVAFYPPCRTVASGTINGSEALIYRLTTPVPDLPGFRDPDLRPAAAEVFQPAGPGMWRLVLHAGFGAGSPAAPRLVTTPEGTVLLVPAAPGAEAGAEIADQAYLAHGATGTLLDATRWMAQARSVLPPHACLLPPVTIDWATLTASVPFGPDRLRPAHADGKLHAMLGIGDGALILRSSALATDPARHPSRPGWIERVLTGGGRC